MKRAAWRVGLFALAGLALSVLAVVAVGGRWFADTETAVMRFDGSVFGLQVGAPVVFRGVRVGQVSAFGLAPAGPNGVAIPVTATFQRAMLRDLITPTPASSAPVLVLLVQRGLVARLALQSLLTGQLYVDLDLAPDPPHPPAAVLPVLPAGLAGLAGLPVIPTAPTRFDTLQAQLDGLDLGQIGRDLAALAQSARLLLAGPEPARALARSADAAQAIERLASRIERDLVPLGQDARSTLAETRRAVQQLGQGALQVGSAASQIGSSAAAVQAQAGALAAAATPLLADLRRTADALTLAVGTLRQAAADDSTLRLGADRALQDVSRAARSLRELTDTLERQPDLLLRGRAPAP